MELAEAVDLHQLPSLWAKHDLNVQGDANRFVNSLVESLPNQSFPLTVCRDPARWFPGRSCAGATVG